MRLGFSFLRNRPALAYSAGNILNTLMLLLLLPTLLRIDPSVGSYAASGLLASQIAAVLASYSFPLVTPRTLTRLDPAASISLLRQILIYQVGVGLIGLCLLLIFLPTGATHANLAIATFLIGFSAVLQWQWFHIGRETHFTQSLLLLGSRMLVLSLEFASLFKLLHVRETNFSAVLVLVGLIVVPIWPTVKMMVRSSHNEPAIDLLGDLRPLRSELANGKDLFFASVLTSVYILGPSVLVATFNPTLLVAIQQFDRLRISMSSLAGMLLSTVYPLLLRCDHSTLIQRFSRMQYVVVLPAALAAVTFFFSAPWLPNWQPQLLRDMHISMNALMLSIACAIAASASNVITITFLHPLNNDRLYRYAIILGALLFLLSIAVIHLIGNWELGLPVMLAASLAEISILLALWVVARSVIDRKNSR
jgi:hypothetical protein